MGDRQTKMKVEDACGACSVDVLPVEILRLIFTYVPPRDLVLNCSRVCKLWQELLKDDVFWRRQCDSAGVVYPADFAQHSNTQLLDYRRLYFSRPFCRNLVKNWNAAGKFTYCGLTSERVNRVKNRFDKFWSNRDLIYNYCILSNFSVPKAVLREVFLQRFVNVWYCLPDSVVTSHNETVNQFKNLVKSGFH